MYTQSKKLWNMYLIQTLEVSIDEAHELHKAYEVGDKIRFEVTPKDFGRIAAQTAKQVISNV